MVATKVVYRLEPSCRPLAQASRRKSLPWLAARTWRAIMPGEPHLCKRSASANTRREAIPPLLAAL
jgi:hypothetical protein